MECFVCCFVHAAGAGAAEQLAGAAELPAGASELLARAIFVYAPTLRQSSEYVPDSTW
jgi:hypothetical protein